MLPKVSVLTTTAAATLSAFLLVLPVHGHDHHEAVGNVVPAMVSKILSNSTAKSMASGSSESALTYFSYPEFKGLMIAHIVLMVLAWVVVLPIGEQKPPFQEAIR